jgi:signal transduction histidine kinase
MPNGGKLCVSTSCENDNVMVEIGDTAAVFPPKSRAHFRAILHHKDVGKGTGLGLGVSYRIIAGRHSGDIHVESRPGDTRFQVRLPIRYKAD